MVAALNQEVALDRRELADLYVLDVSAKPAHRNIVLGFAIDGSSMASDTGFLIDDKPVLHPQIILNRSIGGLTER